MSLEKKSLAQLKEMLKAEGVSQAGDKVDGNLLHTTYNICCIYYAYTLVFIYQSLLYTSI